MATMWNSLMGRRQNSQGDAASRRVLVVGAGGRTGSIVLRKLLEKQGCGVPRALVRSEESKQKLCGGLGELGKNLDVVIGDVTCPETLASAFKGVTAVVVASGAAPRLSKLSLVGVITMKVVTLGMVSSKPSFWFDAGQSPEEVEWEGHRNVIDAAKAAGVKHLVLVSSMAGTKPDHFLNTQMDNCVLWKRKAECYLISSGVPYTIIHPGGLLPHFGGNADVPGGRRQLYAGVNDELLDDGAGHTQIPREDVAEVCVKCLEAPSVALGRSFDLGAGQEGEGEVFKGDLKALLETLGGKDCAYTQADAAFSSLDAAKGRHCCVSPPQN